MRQPKGGECGKGVELAAGVEYAGDDTTECNFAVKWSESLFP